ncbi:MAG: TonB-dependent receptor plug domain-containing protein [Pseudomonadales bacterium]|nr:TonB-dependent receptor plug domain-containing protein [Pseudomonadales bacterium]
MPSRKLLVACIATAISSTAFAQPPEIEEISVIGQFVPDEKRGTDQIANVVGGEEFTRTGDSNIAESLKRISGLSTVGGKYVYVRGLGERYSTTLLNGAILPSPEPINRVVPMDLFPTAVLDSVLVQKTYSAAYPSEFGGGVLQMRTKKSTDDFFFNLSSSLGMTGNTTFKDGYTLSGGDRDWLGYDDGFREAPQALQQATANDQELRRLSPFTGVGVPVETLQDVGRSFNNQYTPSVEDAPVDVDVSASLGNSHELGSGGAKFNYMAAVDYSNSWQTNEIERNTWVPSNDGLTQQEGLLYRGTENSIDISSIVSAGLDFNDNHNVRLTSVLLRKTDDLVARTAGFTEAASDLEITEIEWIERELFSNQLQGDHFFPEFNELAINWRYSHIKAERDSPDEREYRYDSGEFSSRVDGNLRNYSVLDDTADDFGLDLSMVFYGPLNSMITTQAGYVYAEKERESEIRRFGFAFVGPIANDPDLLVLPMEQILASENISPEGFQIREITRPTDNYEANNELEAFYAQVEFNFDDRFRFTFGGRQEDFYQRADTFDLFSPEQGITSELEQNEFLPAFSATFIHYDHQFRAAYSETVSRPDFRELSPAAFTNPETGKEIVGNPDLLITDIKNYDFRWEWYFAFSDYMSLGLFYKEFTNPIEQSIVSPVDRKSTYINAQAAENKGVEYEIYKRLDFLGEGFFNGLGEDLYVQGNVAFIDSEVTIREEDQNSLTSLSRPMQGQSDWLFNAQIGYEPMSGTTATLLYHYYGERIAEVGIEGAPDLIEQPFGELNFVFIKELADNWTTTFKAKNILDERSEITQDGNVTTGYNKGRQLSLQLDYRF